MIRENLKMVWRIFQIQKIQNSLNIIGLATGIASFVLISLYVSYELSYDKFHKDYKKIVRVRSDFFKNGDQLLKSAQGFPGLGPTLKKEYPDIVTEFVRLVRDEGTISTTAGEPKAFSVQNVFYCDSSISKVLTIDWIHGNSDKVFHNPGSMALSTSMARKFFNTDDAVGQSMMFNSNTGQHAYLITGVFADIAPNSHLKIDYLLSNEVFVHDFDNPWGGLVAYTYLLLAEEPAIAQLESKLPDFVETNLAPVLSKNEISAKLSLQPLSTIHLNSDLANEITTNSDYKNLYFLVVIAVLVLGIAWINFINLAASKSIDRSKEISIRKILGSGKKTIVGLFLVDNFVIHLFSLILALGLVVASSPLLKSIIKIEGPLFSFDQLSFWLVLFGVFIFGSIISSVYPSLLGSSINPLEALKGKTAKTKSSAVRNALVVFQFSISFVVIAVTICISQQLSFMQNQDLGLSIDQTIVVKGPSIRDSIYLQKEQLFKDEVSKYSRVKGATVSTAVPGQAMFHRGGEVTIKGAAQKNTGVYFFNWVDEDFIDSYQMKLAAGRNFSRQIPGDVNTIVINKEACQLLGYHNENEIIGKQIEVSALGDEMRTLEVIGVVNNFHQEDLTKNYSPILFMLQQPPRLSNFVSFKVESAGYGETIRFLEQKYKEVFPGNPFEFFFLDDFFNEKYSALESFRKTFLLFAILAVIISSMGLFGSVYYNTSRRTKEIGIRKSLGATSAHVFGLLIFDSYKLILISFLFAAPLSFYLIKRWLSDFSFHIPMHAGLFIWPALITTVFAFLTIIYHTAKASSTPPVDSLRIE